MWIVLWILLSAFVLGVFGWSLIILQQQKAAWAAFAKKAGFNYTRGRYSESPTLVGMTNGRKVSFSSAPRPTEDGRGQRFLTVIEIELGRGLPAAAAIATKEYADFVGNLRLDQTYKPASPDWQDSYIIKTKDSKALAGYLTPERIKTLHSLFSMTSARVLFFFDEIEAVLHVETTDSLRNADRMEKILKRLLKTADDLTPEESSAAAPAQDASGTA